MIWRFITLLLLCESKAIIGMIVVFKNTLVYSVAYQGIFFEVGGGGVQQIQLRTENGNLGDGSPLPPSQRFWRHL